MADISWKDWNPGLENGNKTLREVQQTLPGNDPEAINFIVRLFENPKSPIAFKGAISLERHDCVHILLGRGLLPQDEAFVIGYTMGTSGNISDMEAGIFKMVTQKLYPHPYKFSPNDLEAYNLGIRLGKLSSASPIYDYPFEDKMDQSLATLRKELDIDVGALKKVYACEQIFIPGSKESARLPV